MISKNFNRLISFEQYTYNRARNDFKLVSGALELGQFEFTRKVTYGIVSTQSYSHSKDFYWLWIKIQDCLVFALLRFVVSPDYSRHFSNQSDSKTKPLMLGHPRFLAL